MVCGLQSGGNKKSVVGRPANPNSSEPAGLDLGGRRVRADVNDVDWQPSTELRLIAEQAPHAERHARTTQKGLVHLLSRPNGRESGLRDNIAGGVQVCNGAL